MKESEKKGILGKNCNVFAQSMDTEPAMGCGLLRSAGPANRRHKVFNQVLSVSSFDTQLGPMVAIADEAGLYVLEFADRCGRLDRAVEKLRSQTKAVVVPGMNDPIASIIRELASYFDGELWEFKTQLHILGSAFQKSVWGALVHIPYGQTQSYQNQAAALGHVQACRAVANANANNRLAIVIPCHRVIRSNGDLGGYGGGVERKQWLLDHEKRNA